MDRRSIVPHFLSQSASKSQRAGDPHPAPQPSFIAGHAVGTPIFVQQKLMRHRDIRTTMDLCSDVVTDEMA